jgi:hypothetical protein
MPRVSSSKSSRLFVDSSLGEERTLTNLAVSWTVAFEIKFASSESFCAVENKSGGFIFPHLPMLRTRATTDPEQQSKAVNMSRLLPPATEER